MASFFPSSGAEIDEVVADGDDIEIMLYDDDGVPGIAQAVEDLKQDLDVLIVKARGGFIEEVKDMAGGAFREFTGELDPLGLAAGEGVRRLAETDVAEADVIERIHDGAELGDFCEKGAAFLNGHGEDVGDIFSAIADFERLAIIALALTSFTGNPDVREEVHVDPDRAATHAFLTAAAFDIEAEAARFVAALAGDRELPEEVAHEIKGAGVSRRIRAGALAEWALINDDHFFKVVQSFDALMRTGGGFCAMKVTGEGFAKDAIDQGRLTTSAGPGDADELAERDVDAVTF